MAEFFYMLEQIELVERLLRRRAIIRDRSNPFIEYDDTEFISRFRMNKAGVLVLLDRIGDRLDNTHTTATCIPPVLQLTVALRFYASSSYLKVTGDLFGIDISTVSRIVAKVTREIASLRGHFIFFPGADETVHVHRRFHDIAGIPGVVGAIDCTHIAIQSPGGDQAELYRNRKGYFSINVQAIGDSNYMIRNIVARWPGSTHDSRIFDNSHICARFEHQEINGILVGDSGYPLRPYLVTPVLRPQTRAQRRYNYALCKTRVVIENLFGILKRRFPCLKLQLRLKLDTSLAVIVACAVLHNICRQTGAPLPDDGPVYVNDVPVPVPQNNNQGGQPLRAVLIRQFE